MQDDFRSQFVLGWDCVILAAPGEVGVTCSRNRNVTMATLFLCFVLRLGDKQQMSRSLLNYEPWSYRCARFVCAQRNSSIFVYRLPGHTQPPNFSFTRVKFDFSMCMASFCCEL